MGGVKVQRLPAQSAWPPAEMIPPCSRGTMANDRTERLVDLPNTNFTYDIEGNLTVRTDGVAWWSVRWDNSGGSIS